MRTTVEISDEYRSRLLQLAARRGEKGFSTIIEEALGAFFDIEARRQEQRQEALSMRGCLSEEEASKLLERTRELREHWR